MSYLILLFQDYGGGSEPDAEVAEDYRGQVGGDDFVVPILTVREEDLKAATPIGGGVPWKCVVTPEMEILGCYSAHVDDEGFELLESHIGG